VSRDDQDPKAEQTAPDRPAARPSRVEPAERTNWLWELFRTWGPAILAVLLIRWFVFEPFRIPSGSMVPTLQIGDHVVVTKFSYGVWTPKWPVELLDLGDPARGDIIVFRYPLDESTHYIKRVIGVPGDRIEVKNNQVILNGEPQRREPRDRYTFIDDGCRTHVTKAYEEDLGGVLHPVLTNTGLGGALADMNEITVPAASVFVMGDNRDNSEDSRRWGFVRYDQIKGKAQRIWLSWDGCTGNVGRVRTERFMRSVYDSWDKP
jgi:signal peptidase I